MNPIASNPARTLWPHAIVAWFVIFASALAAWVTYAVRQGNDLVSTDYYEQEVRFQKQIERESRTAAVRREVVIEYDAAQGQVTLRLPATHLSPRLSGRVHFYRPSDSELDFEVPLLSGAAGAQRIKVASRRAGQWKMQVYWNADDQDYFFEKILVFDEPKGGGATTFTSSK